MTKTDEERIAEQQAYWDAIPLLSDENILRTLRITGFDYNDAIFWREDYIGNLRLMINCNDLFYWGSADCESITDENIDLLENTIDECEQILGKHRAYDGFLLFCARIRQMRPQGAYYKHLDPELWYLFDACGPMREIDLGNPHPHPGSVDE